MNFFLGPQDPTGTVLVPVEMKVVPRFWFATVPSRLGGELLLYVAGATSAQLFQITRVYFPSNHRRWSRVFWQQTNQQTNKQTNKFEFAHHKVMQLKYRVGVTQHCALYFSVSN